MSGRLRRPGDFGRWAVRFGVLLHGDPMLGLSLNGTDYGLFDDSSARHPEINQTSLSARSTIYPKIEGYEHAR